MENKDINNKFRALVRQALQEGKLNEMFDDEEDMGIYGGDFNRDEFKGDAMRAAMSDMGDDFTPLGKSQFEKGMDPEEFMSDLERQNLNLPNDKAERERLKKTMDTKNKHEKMFGAGSLNEDADFDTKNLYSFLKDALYYAESKSMDYAEAAQMLEEALNMNFSIEKKIQENLGQPVASTKVSRPKDSEGNDLKIGSIVKHLSSGQEGKILRFGTTENGQKLVAQIDWFSPVVPVQGTPQSLPGKNIEPTELVIRKETELEEGMGQSFTVGKGKNLKPTNYPENLKR